MDRHWSALLEVNDAVLYYYQRYGKYPKHGINEVQRFLKPFFDNTASAFESAGLAGTWKTVGSVFERVHEIRADGSYELDKKFKIAVTKANIHVEWLDTRPGWAILRKNYWDFLGLRSMFCGSVLDYWARVPIFDDWDQISKRSVLDLFEKVCKLYAPRNAEFSRHGPAVTMKAESPEGSRFAVDLVPAFSVEEVDVFVARRWPGRKRYDSAWVKSYSLEEQKHYPKKSPWAKPCLRIIKAFRDRHEELRQLQSYVLKNVFFSHLKDNPFHAWNEKCVGKRVWELLHLLKKGLDKGYIPQFLEPENNLIKRLPEDVLAKMHDFVRRLCGNKSDFLEAFA